jgi:hypothetical protein
MPFDRSSITTAEIDAMLTATAASRLMNGKNKVAFTGNVRTPTLNMMRGASKSNATPVRGAYRCHFSPPRGQRMQAISGRDIHTFRSVDTLFDVDFGVGRVHLGDEWIHQQIEEAGVELDHEEASVTIVGKIDVTKGGWWTKGADKFEVLVSLADTKLQALELNYVQELNKLFWRSNITDQKLWQGFDAVFPRSSNTTGPVGNKNRSNPTLRHQLLPIANTADMELKVDDLRFLCNKRIGDGSMVNLVPVGRSFYNAVKERMVTGSSAVTAPRLFRNYDNARQEAETAKQKLGFGFPDDSIYLAGVGLMYVEPCWEDLDREDAPAILWEKSAALINTDHVSFRPTKNRDGLKKIHATPYNQWVTRISLYGEYAFMADWLDCHGVTYIP